MRPNGNADRVNRDAWLGAWLVGLAIALLVLSAGPHTASSSQDTRSGDPISADLAQDDSTASDGENEAIEESDDPETEEEPPAVANTVKVTVLAADDDGSDAMPIDGVEVTVTRRSGSNGPKLSEITRSDGTVTFKDVSYGTVVIRAHKNGYQTGGDTHDLDELEESITITLIPLAPPGE